MGKFVLPETYFVGYQEMNDPEVLRYLKDSGNEAFWVDVLTARDQGLSNAEIICSMFAKLCYKSLTVGHNENISKVRNISNNIKGAFDMGHGSVFEHVNFNFVIANCSRVFCYTPDTEILTISGWKLISELESGEQVLTLNPITKLARWSVNKKTHIFEYDGPVHWFESSQWRSPAFTPDHLLWAANYDLRAHRGLSLEKIASLGCRKVPYAAVADRRLVVDHRICMESTVDPQTITIGKYDYDAALLFEWLGWLVTDGMMAKRKNRCAIAQSKPHGQIAIRLLMDKLFGNRWREYLVSHSKHVVGIALPHRLFAVSDKELYRFAIEHLGRTSKERNLRCLYDYSPRLLAALYKGALAGDGNTTRNHEVLYCYDIDTAKQWQVILAMLGHSSMVRPVRARHETHTMACGITITSKSDVAMLSVHRKGASVIRKSLHRTGAYLGPVYCPETEDGLVYVRRHGMAFWCGNTHELVRHRIGTAFSQNSGRYIRLDSIDLILDPILTGCDDLILKHLERTEDLVYLMECRKNLRVPSPNYPNSDPEHYLELRAQNFAAEDCKWVPNEALDFTLKKQLTSAIRRLAPNGQANEIGFSVNLRSLRHTVMMRTGRHSEWEIRMVFAQVYNLLKAKYPLIFYGAKEEMVNGSLEVSGMKMQPYEKTAEVLLSELSDEQLEAELTRRKTP